MELAQVEESVEFDLETNGKVGLGSTAHSQGPPVAILVKCHEH